MSSVTGVTEIEYRFDIDDVKDFVGHHLTPVQVQEVAHILAANVEVPEQYDENGNILIVRENFNDAFYDMEEDLQERFS